MKKRIFVAVAMVVVFVLALAATAYATWGDSTYASSPATGNAPDSNPHKNYGTTSVKCAVCHSVHGAWSGGQKLLKDTTGNACNYCHVSTTSGYVYVYNGVASNYTTISEKAHNYVSTNDTWFASVECKDCHTVHGSGTVTISGTGRNLKQLNPAATVAQYRKDNVGTTYNSLGYGYDSVATPNLTDMSQWCAGCHPYRATAVNGRTHAMTTNLTQTVDGVATKVAWADSSQCANCHDSNTFTGGTGTTVWFPHITDGARFLNYSTNFGAADVAVPVGGGKYDGVCLKCHKGSATTGVGFNF